MGALGEGVVESVNESHRNRDYLPDIDLPHSLRATSSIEEACTGADVVVMGVPSHGFRTVLESARLVIANDVPVISLSKGIEQGTGLRMTQVVADVLSDHRRDRIGVLTGPNLAREVALGQPTASVVALDDAEAAKMLQQVFMTETFRVYTNPDVIGCEIAGALKNVIALGAGIADGLGYGDNTKAALITRGLAELARLGVSLGGDPLTFSGLAGMGDLVATCTSEKSRNRTVGVALGQGQALDEIVREMKMVAEGVKSTEAVLELAAALRHRDADRRGSGRGALRGSAPGRHRSRAHAPGGQARAARHAVIVGGLGAAGRAHVDERGRIVVHGEHWSLDWWLGADDRWRIPAGEEAVRHSTLGAAPVSEVRVRVPGGDAIHVCTALVVQKAWWSSRSRMTPRPCSWSCAPSARRGRWRSRIRSWRSTAGRDSCSPHPPRAGASV